MKIQYTFVYFDTYFFRMFTLVLLEDQKSLIHIFKNQIFWSIFVKF